MDRIVDIHEVQEHLKEAAQDARRGADKVRAGRFLHREASAERRSPNSRGPDTRSDQRRRGVDVAAPAKESREEPRRRT